MAKKKTNKNEPTVMELLLFMRDHMATKEDLKALATKAELAVLDLKVGSIRADLDHLKIHMVTKEYLSDKLADAVADIGRRINKLKEEDRGRWLALLAAFKKNSLVDIKREILKIEQLV